MNFSTGTYIFIGFALLASLPFGHSVSTGKKQCTWHFSRAPDDPTHSWCSDNKDTYSFPNEDCKPNINPKNPPAASKCVTTRADKYGNLNNGNCPTYRASGNYPTNSIKRYTCYLMTKQGMTGKKPDPSKDTYGIYKCDVLTNLISCTGTRGKKVTNSAPNFT
ncbi:secreted protein [Melampsora americana]|nr:secreted protein [Melampsora americana]